MASLNREELNYNIWYLDTDSTNHVIEKNELFVKIDESVRNLVKFVDDNTIPIMRKGKILIQSKNCDHQYISEIFYISSMKNNLLSMKQLLEKGYKM